MWNLFIFPHLECQKCESIAKLWFNLVLSDAICGTVNFRIRRVWKEVLWITIFFEFFVLNPRFIVMSDMSCDNIVVNMVRLMCCDAAYFVHDSCIISVFSENAWNYFWIIFRKFHASDIRLPAVSSVYRWKDTHVAKGCVDVCCVIVHNNYYNNLLFSHTSENWPVMGTNEIDVSTCRVPSCHDWSNRRKCLQK